MEKKKIKVVVADDHAIFRAGLTSMLVAKPDINIVGEAYNGVHLLEKLPEWCPHVVLMDIKMPVMDGIIATRKIYEINPHIKVIGLSVSVKDEAIVGLLDAGAVGYITKSSEADEIYEAIVTVYQGRPYFCNEISLRLADLHYRNYQLPQENETVFTDRELEIIRFVCMEFTSKEIAETLHISKRTVEGHRTRIMDKIGAKSIAGIITYAVENGLYQS